MPDESNTRMYSRRGGDEGPQRPVPGGPSKEQAGSPAGPARQQYEASMERLHERGVSHLTLGVLIDRVHLEQTPDLENQVAAAQMARMGSCGVAKAKEFEDKSRYVSLAEMDEQLLDTALQLKPVNTLEQLLELHGTCPEIRQAHQCVLEKTTLDAQMARERPDMVALVVAFRALVDSDAAFLVMKSPARRREQLERVRELARDCHGMIRKLMRNHQIHKMQVRERQKKGPQSYADEEGPPPDMPKPTRITKESMKDYYSRDRSSGEK